MSETGGIYNDKQGPNANYVTYGEPLLAVADGQVIAVKDGIVEYDTATGEIAVEGGRRTLAGNYVMLDIGDSVAAVYGHLQPGSLNVSKGNKVKRGNVLGLLGDSGNSDLPHLDFHLETITEQKSPISGDGILFQFRTFDQLAIYTVEEVGKAYAAGSADVNAHEDERVEEFPAKSGVLMFE